MNKCELFVIAGFIATIALCTISAIIMHHYQPQDDNSFIQTSSTHEFDSSDCQSYLTTASTECTTTCSKDVQTIVTADSTNTIESLTSTESSTTTTVVIDQKTPSGVALTLQETRMLSVLVSLEAGGESYECKKGVASVVINRMLTSGMSLRDVIYQKGQFSTAYKVESSDPHPSCIDAVHDVLTNGRTLPVYVTFFRSGHYHNWGDQIPYVQINNTYFSYSESIRSECE